MSLVSSKCKHVWESCRQSGELGLLMLNSKGMEPGRVPQLVGASPLLVVTLSGYMWEATLALKINRNILEWGLEKTSSK